MGLTPEQEIRQLELSQYNDEHRGLQVTGWQDALLVNYENAGVHFADDRPEASRILDAEGFDHTTGCDTAFDSSHAGAMICAGYAMMSDEG